MIEKEIKALTAAVQELTAAIQGSAVSAPAPAPEPTAEPTQAQADPRMAKFLKMSQEDQAKTLKAALLDRGMVVAKDIISRFGAKRVIELDSDTYPQVYEDVLANEAGEDV